MERRGQTASEATVSATDDGARHHPGNRAVAAPRCEVRSARPGDSVLLAQHIRPQDILEIDAATGGSALQAIELSLRASRDPKAGFVDDRLAFLCGIGQATALSQTGVPWLLGTPVLDLHAKRFLRQSREYIADAALRYKFLVNYVDARNAASIKWLTWLGFTLDEPKPFGVAGLPFHRFFMGEPYV